MNTPELLLLVQAASTWFLAGLIWVVQIVHYPLMDRVGESNWLQYERAHMHRITRIVAPAMLIEAGSCAMALVLALSGTASTDSIASSPPLHITLAALLAVIWASTWLLQVPAHNTLTRGFDAAAHRRLVRSNWVRTTAWSTRAVILGLMLYTLI